MTGSIRVQTNPAQEKIPAKFLTEIEDEEVLTSKDIYKELKLRGYQYTGPFRSLKSASLKGTRGRIAWMKNWAVFMDNMLQMKILNLDTRALYVPTAIRKLVIDVKVHNEKIRNLTEDNNGNFKSLNKFGNVRNTCTILLSISDGALIRNAYDIKI